MADPISIVAVSAAVGGVAGKVAEKAWDSAQGWLRERFGSHQAAARNQAEENAAKFVGELAKEVRALEDQQRLLDHDLSESQIDPQFSLVLQRSLLSSAQTSNAEKHSLLARLVAERLANPPETTIALASQLAADAIALSTYRQLLLLALSCFLHEVRPKEPRPLPRREYHTWLNVGLAPCAEYEFKDIDARHLVALSCISYDPASGRDLDILLCMKNGMTYRKRVFAGWDVVEDLQFHWAQGLAGVLLTSVGSIVGSLVLDQLLGMHSALPEWD